MELCTMIFNAKSNLLQLVIHHGNRAEQKLAFWFQSDPGAVGWCASRRRASGISSAWPWTPAWREWLSVSGFCILENLLWHAQSVLQNWYLGFTGRIDCSSKTGEQSSLNNVYLWVISLLSQILVQNGWKSITSYIINFQFYLLLFWKNYPGSLD